VSGKYTKDQRALSEFIVAYRNALLKRIRAGVTADQVIRPGDGRRARRDGSPGGTVRRFQVLWVHEERLYMRIDDVVVATATSVENFTAFMPSSPGDSAWAENHVLTGLGYPVGHTASPGGRKRMKRLLLIVTLCLFAGLGAYAGEKGVMHCFAFSEVEAATPADWEAFAKATDELPGKIPGLLHLIHGKLARPLGLPSMAAPLDEETTKKYRAGEAVQANVKMLRRQYGVCMHFKDEESYKVYGKHEAHAAWVKAYEKVRISGTTTYQILGK
jgi:hypothetical protein